MIKKYLLLLINFIKRLYFIIINKFNTTFKDNILNKKILIPVSVLFTIILIWIVFIFLFPVSIIEGETYNTNKLKKLGKQRELAYNEMYVSLQDELSKMINNLYIKPIYTKNTDGAEKYIINNGDISFLEKINEFNLLYLTNAELRILRNTFYAKYGYTFQSNDLSEHFNGFPWYNSQYSNVDEKLTEYDKYIVEMIRKIENEQIITDIRSILEIFYTKSINIDETYFQFMTECKNNISFPLQKKKQYLLIEIFPAYIDIIEYNNQFYNQFALNLFMEQYENIIKDIVEAKTNDFIDYIYYYSDYSAIGLFTANNFDEYNNVIIKNIFDYYISQCVITNQIINKINYSNISLSGDSFLNIPVIGIDNDHYSLIAVHELQNSMKNISPYLIENIKNILLKGVYYQTDVYSENIENYVNWFYSYFTSIDRTLTNIFGFLSGDKSAQEKFYTDNFNRIMNKNANFDYIIEDEMNNQMNIIYNLYYEYLELLNYFSINIDQITLFTLTVNDFMEPYINDIVTYYDNVFEALGNADNYYLQEYTIKDNNIIKTAKTGIKRLADVTFFGGILVDYLALKAQGMLNRSELSRQIIDSMIENQKNKIAIINDPFNYLYDKLKIGSILFVDNFFAGYPAYQHYGVYIGNGNVIHFASLEGQDVSPENGIIHETNLEKFLNGRALQIDTSVKNNFSDNEIIQRARSRLGDKGYNLFTNNCEHFARWCVTGEHISYQVINSPEKLNNVLSVLSENYNMVSKFFELFN
jgi:hypothetical protein